MNQILKVLIISLLMVGTQTSIFANTKGVAKAIILKGSVEAFNPKTKEKISLKKGSWVKEGFMVKTKKKSFVKFLFIDKSQMNLGPKSQMAITKFPKKKAGIITLMKGSLRSKVTKNYLDMKNKNKSKLFIKTKTAAMGVRGTDFLVTYNPINRNTALVTFSGAVAMAQLSNSIRNIRNNQRALERIVSSDKAVIVKKGQFSGVAPGKTQRATIPVKINPAQLESMKGNSGNKSADDQSSTKSQNKPKKKFRNVIPPGVDAKKFSNNSKVEDQVVKVIGAKQTKDVMDKFAKTPVNADAPPPEGMVNKATGEIAPPAGGFIDMGTAQYIPPPPGSAFDASTQTYIPPADMGGFNNVTGDFQHTDYKLTADGKFVPKENNFSRSPASINEKDSNDPSAGPIIAPPQIDQPLEPQFNPDGVNPVFADYNPNSPDGGPLSPTDEVNLDEVKSDIDTSIQDATDARTDILNTSTRVKFNIK
jgi:hypothetical protein